MKFTFTSLILILFLYHSTICVAQTETQQEKTRTFPLGAQWFENIETDLPLPFGVSTFFTHMSRDVDISNVNVAYKDLPKQSIDEYASFELNNKTTVYAIKVDTWVLPFINVYGLIGKVSTNASLDALITYDRIILPGPPVTIPVSNNSTLNGSYFGLGSSIAVGHNNWFVLGDVNYGYSKLKHFEGKIDFWMYSVRTGIQSTIGKKKMRTWVGGLYLSSKRTLNLNINDDNLGLMKVEIYQEAANPWTLQLGTSICLNRRIELLGEIGTNFNDASIGVLSATYRF